MICPFKFSHYEFEGGQDCIGIECGMHKLCGANDTLAAENDVSEVRMDSNDGNADTREKLEADACVFVARAWEAGRTFERRDLNTRSEDVVWSSNELIDLLDRQAAITEAEQREWWGGVVAESQAKVDELTEQRDRWRSNWTERNMAYSELADDYQELEAKVDELTAELAVARKAHAQAEHDAETYREKLGRVLDMVQEMERVGTLVDQEGNVIG